MKDEDIEVEERYRTWIDTAAFECGMDICAMDVLHVKDTGEEYILELNSSAIGLNGRHHDEDSRLIRDLVLRKMEIEFQNNNIEEKKSEKEEKFMDTELLQFQVNSLREEVNHLCSQILALEEKEKEREKESELPSSKKSSFFGKKK